MGPEECRGLGQLLAQYKGREWAVLQHWGRAKQAMGWGMQRPGRQRARAQVRTPSTMACKECRQAAQAFQVALPIRLEGHPGVCGAQAWAMQTWAMAAWVCLGQMRVQVRTLGHPLVLQGI